jgi:hypothetical protein
MSRTALEPAGAPRSARRRRFGALVPLGILGAVVTSLVGACGLSLGTQPFACADGKTCPSGYTCQANVCLEDGQHPKVTRALRVTYINRSEMYWFPSAKGGATLLLNDGFSPGARGVYEVHVGADGQVSPPIMILPFPGEQTVSSAAVALDDTHYGLVTMSFPGALGDGLSLRVHSLPRDGAAAPSDTVISDIKYAFAGGYEPAYLGAVMRGEELDYAFTDPGKGGGIVITRLQKDGTLIGTFRLPLPKGVLPLSGDCLLWKAADGRVMLRTGLDSVHLFSLDIEKGLGAEVPVGDGQPLYGFGNTVGFIVPNADGTQITFETRDLTGNVLATTPAEPYDPNVEPYTGVPYENGALIAPVTSDPAFKTMEIAYLGPDGKYRHVASVDRPGDDGLYSARAFATNGNAFIAWTSFHDQLMDVWVGVSPLGALP